MLAEIVREAAGGPRTRRSGKVGVSGLTLRVRPPYLHPVEGLLRLLRRHDPAAITHSVRVRQFSLFLAQALDLDGADRRRLALAARLHDVGKIAVPTSILHKAGPLNDEELRYVRQHAAVGERLVAPLVNDPLILSAVRHHHERFDGTGYPDGLYGEQIPLLARILAVADSFDALTTARPYRAARPRTWALDEIRCGAGQQFDPEVVDAFLGVAAGWN